MSNISGATASTYAPGALTATTYYRVIATQTGSGCAATATAIAKTVYPALSPGSLTSSTTTICVGGTVTAISPSAPSGGNGTYTYQWKEGTGNATGTSNTNTFTPTGTYLSTAGTYKFTRTVTSCTSGPTSGTFTLIVIADPTVSVASAQSICYNTTPAAMTATPSGGTGTVSYQWQSGAASTSMSNISGATNTTYAPGALTTTTYYRVVATFTGSGCNAATATAIAKTVYPQFAAGSITTASGTTTEGTNPGLTVTNSTVASGGSGTISYQWRRSGTSSATLSGNAASYPVNNDASNYATAGTYYINRYAHDGACNTSWVASTGTYTLTVDPPPPPGSDPNGTWTCGSQIWSGALSYSPPQCDYVNANNGYGYYYTWSCILNSNVATPNSDPSHILCPSPWRIPSRSDFNTLVNCTTNSEIVSAWGIPGFYNSDGVFVGNRTYFWSATMNGTNYAYCLYYNNGYDFRVEDVPKLCGLQVRCVRDL
jgi:hypothetical protein